MRSWVIKLGAFEVGFGVKDSVVCIDGKILGKWEKNGTIKQLMGAINSVGEGRSQIISESEWNDIALIK